MAFDYLSNYRAATQKRKRLRLAVLILLGLALIGVVLSFALRGSQQARRWTAFSEALAAQDYATVVDLYRQTALARTKAESGSERFLIWDELTAKMEDQIQGEIDQITLNLDSAQPLTAAERETCEALAELSGSRLIRFLNLRGENYLTGKITQQHWQHLLEQLLSLQNIQPTLGSLREQLEEMTDARDPVAAAEQLTADQDWYAAHRAWKKIADGEYGERFVREYGIRQLAALERVLQPTLLQEARADMANGRFYTAKLSLQRLLSLFPDDEAIRTELATCETHLPQQLIAWKGVVEHIVIRPLIVRPAVAFDQDSYAASADQSLLLTTEFRKLLTELHQNNYVLVRGDAFLNANGKHRSFMVPEGKKPLVLVIESLYYPVTRQESGTAYNLVLDAQQQVCATYPGPDGEMVIEREGEAIGILEHFLEQHPDFSFDGAKGTLALNGAECVLGYITNTRQLAVRNDALQRHGHPQLELDADALAKEAAAAKAVLDRLKERGWHLAANTHARTNVSRLPLAALKADVQAWQQDVGALTGPVNALYFPFGAFIPYSRPESAWLRNQGFHLFSGYGPRAYAQYGANYIHVDLTPINGQTLRNPTTYKLQRFCDVQAVLDRQTRP